MLGTLDQRLQALSGIGTFDLQQYTTGAQFDAAFHAWGMNAYLARAGFNLGFDYLFMLLSGLAMFYSGVIVMEAFAPEGSRFRRLLSILALVPLVAAGLDAIENGLQLSMLWNAAPTDALARTAHTVTLAKTVGMAIGQCLLLAAIFVRVRDWWRGRRQRGVAGA